MKDGKLEVGDKVYKCYQDAKVISVFEIDRVSKAHAFCRDHKFKIETYKNDVTLVGGNKWDVHCYRVEDEKLIELNRRCEALELIQSRNFAYYDNKTLFAISDILLTAKPYK